ncbi:PREDICTED: natural killer cells antigen CD94-like [Hipposideros armiger]|uniref:Natural killer cells antigen CD94 n=1 Tax=Hipposideros armiger TaxID=186990 RepID=A0A8B7QCH2_HIPAR|nr:PREDICTED: natural killer cells antigen CD94-like [Hipposideros armiger]
MAVLGILLKNSFLKQSIRPTSSPGGTTEAQEGFDCCSCQEKWIGYRCNCYFISNEKKTWAESRDFCTSQNSSLLHLQNKDELNFMISSAAFYWTGLSYSEESGAWLWEDGSALSPDLFLYLPFTNTRNCLLYSSLGVLHEACERKHCYIYSNPPAQFRDPTTCFLNKLTSCLTGIDTGTTVLMAVITRPLFLYSFSDHSMEVDFWDLSSNVPCVDG